MHSWTWRAIIFGALLTVLVYTATRPDPETAGLSTASPSQLVDLLTNPRHVVRRSAAARLLAQGTNAVPALINAVPQSDEDELHQIFLVLEDLYVSTDEEVADVAEDALEQLSASGAREVRMGAEQVFQANMARRHLRACAKIESFGGRFVNSPTILRRGDPEYPLVIVVIPAEWTGGDEGLKYLKRILPTLIGVHIEAEAPLSEEAVERLTNFIAVRREHEACLGVELQERSDLGLMIRRLVAHSPASLANLERGDQIVKFAGLPVANYSDFITALRQRRTGEEIEVVVRREDALVPVAVSLGSDFATGRCRCEGDTAELPEEAGGDEESRGRFLPATDRVSPFHQDPMHPRHGFPHRPPFLRRP